MAWRFRYFRTDRMASATLLEQHIPVRRAILRAQWQTAMDEERERYRQAAVTKVENADYPISG